MTEIGSGIHRIEAEVGGRPLYLFLFLGEQKLLLDAGCSTTVEASILPYLAALGLGPRDLDLLLITHPDLDHQGGIHALAAANPSLTVACGTLDLDLVSDPEVVLERRYSAYVAGHGIGYDEETAAWMREMCGEAHPVDRVFAGGETIRLAPGWDLSVFHVPGHSAGHLAVQDSRTGAFFSGDCVQGSVYLGLDGTPKLCPTYTDVDPYLETIERVRTLAPSELHGCHWPTARGSEVDAFLDESRTYVEHLDELVRACLGEAGSGLTLRELIACVNGRLPRPWEPDVAAELVYSLNGHLERLVGVGAARAERSEGGPIVYYTEGPTVGSAA
jgi:glyoxylase-like metal-dependent hydrolase (beta-lactamase superfamily II)